MLPEVVPDVSPGDVIQVGVIQELLAIHLVEDEGEDDQGDDGADHQPQPGHRDVQHRPPARHVGQGQVQGEAVDDGVDLHVDGQAVHQPSQNINFLNNKIYFRVHLLQNIPFVRLRIIVVGAWQQFFRVLRYFYKIMK